MNYNPQDWYWLADDGRVYSSKVQQIVDQEDEDFVAWQSRGMSPTPWPRDTNDEQTEEELQATLAPYQLFVGLKSYAANKRWEKEQGGIMFGGAPIATDDRSKMLILGARSAAKEDDSFTTAFARPDGSRSILDAATVIALSDALLSHVKNCFAIFDTVCNGIEDGSITNRSQVDDAFDGS